MEGDDQSGDGVNEQLTRWMGFSDVFCSTVEEIAEHLDRIAEITERQAGEAFDHLEAVSDLTDIGRLFAGAKPEGEREELIEQHLQAMLAGYVRADYLRQALEAMAGLLRGYVSEANLMGAETMGANPSLRSGALDVARHMRAMHEQIGLTSLRQRMLGRLGGLEIAEESEEEERAHETAG